ncbi:ZIP family metal transporter [Comamonas terrigena]|uniref:ZIP family metal transporter n=1 Tax=Comamonas terrigena TaxID=32013 RepID=UPI00244A1988|nr:ZIP family metal transporter [Comamonas terrigena]MDH0051384.1 ZIP family metal transporter [Comamonas terrigena]MDH0513796.1 ZIP family metal transporter [Comamonas terrigena]MDH1093333.1 ZIP family metal transporter [Comamonas terrigena]MDH1293391.1 ZIP family metal transporter [Comamonas terrigena]MDH1502922.1 ZIP family metal transporter [Comamonas terrigena]
MLFAILLGTFIAGVASVAIAFLLSRSALARYPKHMLSLAAGALLATAFVNLLPEAFESDFAPQTLFWVFFVGLIVVILLDKAEIWHHAHEHSEVSQADISSHHHSHGASGSWSVLFGDGVHAFADGILIASAFVADWKLGVAASFAVLLHEVPHHMGDLAVVSHMHKDARAALIKVSLAGSATVLGGLVGYLLVSSLAAWLPLFLVIAASSFVYVALADLIPQLNTPMGLKQSLSQMAWLLAGAFLVSAAVSVVGGHGH